MIDRDVVTDLEVEALLMYQEAGLDPERPATPAQLCEALYGTAPEVRRRLPRQSLMGLVRGEVRIFIDESVAPQRARWLAFHEISHARFGAYSCSAADSSIERRCDLLGACLAAPRPAFEKMMKECGHGVYDLAHAFGTTQALAMLRLGEVTGRPVRLDGPIERVRGEPFAWPEDLAAAFKGRLRKVAHPIRLADEGRWGLMAVG